MRRDSWEKVVFSLEKSSLWHVSSFSGVRRTLQINYGSNKSTGKETGKTHLCEVAEISILIENKYFVGDCRILFEFSQF